MSMILEVTNDSFLESGRYVFHPDDLCYDCSDELPTYTEYGALYVGEDDFCSNGAKMDGE